MGHLKQRQDISFRSEKKDARSPIITIAVEFKIINLNSFRADRLEQYLNSQLDGSICNPCNSKFCKFQNIRIS